MNEVEGLQQITFEIRGNDVYDALNALEFFDCLPQPLFVALQQLRYWPETRFKVVIEEVEEE